LLAVGWVEGRRSGLWDARPKTGTARRAGFRGSREVGGDRARLLQVRNPAGWTGFSCFSDPKTSGNKTRFGVEGGPGGGPPSRAGRPEKTNVGARTCFAGCPRLLLRNTRNHGRQVCPQPGWRVESRFCPSRRERGSGANHDFGNIQTKRAEDRRAALDGAPVPIFRDQEQKRSFRIFFRRAGWNPTGHVARSQVRAQYPRIISWRGSG